jgi:hypothetical protein
MNRIFLDQQLSPSKPYLTLSDLETFLRNQTFEGPQFERVPKYAGQAPFWSEISGGLYIFRNSFADVRKGI